MITTTSRELDPDTSSEESTFREQVRDILGLSPFTRREELYAELRRLKALDHISILRAKQLER